jgi:hypothetical protein
MSIYHIALRTGSHVRETVEIEKESYLAVRVEVAAFVGELLRDHANQVWADEDWRVDVTDEQGLILFVMHIAAIETSAAMSSPA